MQRETFPFKTMRQIVTGLDRVRLQRRFKTTGEALRGVDLTRLQPLINDKAIAVALEQEQRRFVRQNQALKRLRQRTMRTRARLLATKAKNERLMVLRHNLQKQRWLEAAGDTRSRAVPALRSSDEQEGRPKRRFREVTVRRG
jgi:hypothetical protein